MDMLKKFFPYSFGAKDVAALVIKIIVYVVASALLGFVLGIIPFIGGILGTLVGLYCTAGWVIALLDYLKVLK